MIFYRFVIVDFGHFSNCGPKVCLYVTIPNFVSILVNLEYWV